MRSLNRLIGRVFVAVAVLAEVANAAEPCPAPPFRAGKVLVDSPSEIDLHISISLQDFAPGRLICLATELKQRYGGRNVWAAIFSSHEAAVAYSPVTVEENPVFRAAQAKLHAFYTYDKAKEEDQLLILPDGLNHQPGSPLTTRIDLPVDGTASCRVELDSRCLLDFRHMDYPSVQAFEQLSGTVTLSGNVGRDGRLSNMMFLDANVNPPERQSLLVDWAKQNFCTWRFEVAKHKDPVRITYHFEISDPFPAWPETHVSFRLPSDVTIQLGPKRQ